MMIEDRRSIKIEEEEKICHILFNYNGIRRRKEEKK